LWFWFLKFSFRSCGFVGFDLWGFEFRFHLLIYWFCCWSMYGFINLLQNNLLLIYGFDLWNSRFWLWFSFVDLLILLWFMILLTFTKITCYWFMILIFECCSCWVCCYWFMVLSLFLLLNVVEWTSMCLFGL
jgi:hypothetical protein